jgi:hypothetical protein
MLNVVHTHTRMNVRTKPHTHKHTHGRPHKILYRVHLFAGWNQNHNLSGDQIYIYYLELPLYNGGVYHQGRSSGASILYKTIMYNKFIAYSL